MKKCMFIGEKVLHCHVILSCKICFLPQVVTVESVSNTVQILPTKTKPKKLILLGSDGKR